MGVYAAIRESGFYEDMDEVVSGGARGVDRLGEECAKEFVIPIKQFIPDWDKEGRSAGYKRNAEMAEYADALIAVWDGDSKGTKHMIECMNKLNKKVYIHIVS